MNKERLLNAVRALRESPKPEKFTMLEYAVVWDSGLRARALCGPPRPAGSLRVE